MNTKNRYTFTLTIICATGLFMHPEPSLATGSIQSRIYLECQNLHSAASGNPALQEEIVRTCSASNAAVRVTMPEIQRSDTLMPPPPLPRPVPAGRESGTISESNTFSPFSRDGTTGRSAGDTFNNIGVWASVDSGTLDNDFANTPYDMSNRGFQVGVDYQPTDYTLLGLTAGYGNNDTDTPFNGGEMDTDTVNVAVYGAMALGSNFSVDAALGYSDINTEQTRLTTGIAGLDGNFASLPAGTVVSSDVDSSRLFGAINLNGFWNPMHFLIEAKVGYLYAETDQDGFTETAGGLTNQVNGETYVLSQWHAGATLGYDFGTFLEPYAGVDYSYDISREEVRVAPGFQQPANDRSELMVRLGMRYFGDNGVSAALEWNTNALRQDIDSNSLMLSLRLDL